MGARDWIGASQARLHFKVIPVSIRLYLFDDRNFRCARMRVIIGHWLSLNRESFVPAGRDTRT